MAARTRTQNTLDLSGVALSCLCLLHCMALPLLALSVPVLAVVSETEWVHKTFVLLAVPVALLAIFTVQPARNITVIIALMIMGVSLLIAGAFIEALHDHETLLTVFGALALGSAHICRWRTHVAVQ